MKYIVDRSCKYLELIENSLKTYNTSHIGDKLKDDRYFYLIDERKLLGGVHVNLSWDWVTINKIKFDSIETLNILVENIGHYYHSKCEGIRFSTNILSFSDKFEIVGFSKTDEVKYSPLMKSVCYLEYTDLKKINDLTVVKNSVEEERIKEELNHYWFKAEQENMVDYNKSDLFIVAFEEEQFAGGVHGIVYEDHMYINLLVVDHSFRGSGVGSVLMKMIEEEVKQTSIKSISLGTTAFQARGFYEKLGYKLLMTQNNLPKGYECYTLIKNI